MLTAAEMTYCISAGNSQIYLLESPEEFIKILVTCYLNIELVTKEELDSLLGYLAVTYPNVKVESKVSSQVFLKCVEVPKQEYHD